MQTYINKYKELRTPVVYIGLGNETDNEILYEDGSYLDLRLADRSYYSSLNAQGDIVAMSIFNLEKDSELNAILGIFRTIFVCLVLTGAALYFSSDAN